VPVESLNTVLMNIGRSDQLLSEEEMKTLLKEAGAENRCIPASKMMQLM